MFIRLKPQLRLFFSLDCLFTVAIKIWKRGDTMFYLHRFIHKWWNFRVNLSFLQVKFFYFLPYFFLCLIIKLWLWTILPWQEIYLQFILLFIICTRAAVVHLIFRAGSTFPVPICTVSPKQTLNRTSKQGWRGQTLGWIYFYWRVRGPCVEF